MKTQIENKLKNSQRMTGLTERFEMVNGTLYVKLLQEERCDFFHKVLRTFYVDNINPSGGVNMYAVGDEFCFDFVPADREAPVFVDAYSDDVGHNVEFRV
jgi:hypothetical protein